MLAGSVHARSGWEIDYMLSLLPCRFIYVILFSMFLISPLSRCVCVLCFAPLPVVLFSMYSYSLFVFLFEFEHCMFGW